MSHPMESPALDGALRAALDGVRRATDVRYAEVRYVDESSERLRVRDGRPEQVTTTTSRGVGVRVLGAKTWGFACPPLPPEEPISDAPRRPRAGARASGAIVTSAVNLPPLGASTGTYTS